MCVLAILLTGCEPKGSNADDSKTNILLLKRKEQRLLAEREHPEGLKALMLEGDSLQEAYAYIEAIKVYNRVLEEDPYYLQALWKKSYAFTQVGLQLRSTEARREHFQEALLWAGKAFHLSPHDVGTQLSMAMAYYGEGTLSNLHRRLTFYRKALRFAQHGVVSTQASVAADVSFIMGLWQQEAALLPTEEVHVAMSYLGKKCFEGVSLEKARDYFKQAVEGAPQNVLYLFHLGEVSYKLGRMDEAQQAFEQVLLIPSPRDGDALLKKRAAGLLKGMFFEQLSDSMHILLEKHL